MANVDDVAKVMADELGLTRAGAKKVMRSFFGAVHGFLEKEEAVFLRGFGQWYHTYQNFNDEYLDDLDRIPEGVERPRLKVCRFSFGSSMKKVLNGICEDRGIDSNRFDYKVPGGHRPHGVQDEGGRRVKHGVSLRAVVDRINQEDSP